MKLRGAGPTKTFPVEFFRPRLFAMNYFRNPPQMFDRILSMRIDVSNTQSNI